MNYYLMLGILGSVMALSGSVPQITHLLRVKDSTGQSITAWFIWLLASLMLLTYAIYAKDNLFIFLNSGWIAFCIIAIFLIDKYKKPRGKKC